MVGSARPSADAARSRRAANDAGDHNAHARPAASGIAHARYAADCASGETSRGTSTKLVHAATVAAAAPHGTRRPQADAAVSASSSGSA